MADFFGPPSTYLGWQENVCKRAEKKQ